jgi:threonine dehydratase
VELRVTLEAFGHDHKNAIMDALRAAGYDVRLVDSKSIYS